MGTGAYAWEPPGAATKRGRRLAQRPDTAGSCQYTDKSERALADHREGSPRRGPAFSDPVGREAEPVRRTRHRFAGKSAPAGAPRWAAFVKQPKHVGRCFENGGRAWWIWNWPRSNPARKTRRPYKCGSWRCEACSRHEASVCFARIKEAVSREEYDPRGWVFMVLTLDRDGFFSGKPWETTQLAYKALGKLCTSLLERTRYRQKKLEWRLTRNEWAGVVEAHRSGWPHFNLLVYSPELAEELSRESPARPADHSDKCRCPECRDAVLVRGETRAMVVASGWGPQSTAERVRDLDALAGYVTKLAGVAEESLVAFAGEVAKITQRPLVAPERFRRLRSGKGFLPPRKKNPEITGTLVRRQRELDGTYTAIPLHKAPADVVPHIVQCCYLEESIAHGELIAKARGMPVNSPPVQSFLTSGAGETSGLHSYDTS